MAEDEPTTYKANCHCGAVRFEVTLPQSLAVYKVNQCSCSICTKNGYLLVYPKREDLTYTQGEDNLSDYYFGKKEKAHRFCKTCGTSILIDCKDVPNDHPMKPIFAVNVRTFKDIDTNKLVYRYFDGRSKLEPAYSID